MKRISSNRDSLYVDMIDYSADMQVVMCELNKLISYGEEIGVDATEYTCYFMYKLSNGLTKGRLLQERFFCKQFLLSILNEDIKVIPVVNIDVVVPFNDAPIDWDNVIQLVKFESGPSILEILPYFLQGTKPADVARELSKSTSFIHNSYSTLRYRFRRALYTSGYRSSNLF